MVCCFPCAADSEPRPAACAAVQGGHYVAYVRASDGRWYLCDDAWVMAGAARSFGSPSG